MYPDKEWGLHWLGYEPYSSPEDADPVKAEKRRHESIGDLEITSCPHALAEHQEFLERLLPCQERRSHAERLAAMDVANRRLYSHKKEPTMTAALQAPDQPAPAPLATLPPTANPLDLPAEVFAAGLARRKANRAALIGWVRSALVEGVDYGAIPTKRGASKPSLWKPGAEKICGMLGVTVSFPTLREYEQAALSGVALATVLLRCEIYDANGRIVAVGSGARSLKQDFGDLNKAVKMALKSAQIDATLRLAGLSEIFTQDLEDLPREEPRAPSASVHPKPDHGPDAITGDQEQHIDERIAALGLNRARVLGFCQRAYHADQFRDLTPAAYERLLPKLEQWAQEDVA